MINWCWASKGTLSVVEPGKVIRQRLLAGQESKARRGRTVQKARDWVCPRDAVGKVVFHLIDGSGEADPTSCSPSFENCGACSDIPMVP